MPADQLTELSTFTVKESALTNWIISGVFTVLVIFSLLSNPHGTTHEMKIYYYSILFVLVPAILYMIRGFLHKTIFTINGNGIYQYGALVTNWDNFVTANITQQEITGSIADNFVLVIDYYKPDAEGYFERRIPLTNTQTKSEEEIIAAINFFLELRKQKA
jgi:hypothetical protein